MIWDNEILQQYLCNCWGKLDIIGNNRHIFKRYLKPVKAARAAAETPGREEKLPVHSPPPGYTAACCRGQWQGDRAAVRESEGGYWGSAAKYFSIIRSPALKAGFLPTTFQAA